MIRVVNFLCVALMGFAVLALYHVSEKTRVARVELSLVEHRLQQEKVATSVLQTEWERVANLQRIQRLAETRLGMGDTASLQLSSLELLPRRGDDSAPLGNSPVAQASIRVPASQSPIQLAQARPGF